MSILICPCLMIMISADAPQDSSSSTAAAANNNNHDSHATDAGYDDPLDGILDLTSLDPCPPVEHQIFGGGPGDGYSNDDDDFAISLPAAATADTEHAGWGGTKTTTKLRAGGGDIANSDDVVVSAAPAISSTSSPWSSRDAGRDDGVYRGVDAVINDDGDVVAEGEAEVDEEERTDNRLRPGDHVYVWQSYGINPRAYQRHAVVYSVERRRSGDRDEDDDARPLQGPTLELERHDATTTSFDLDALYANDQNGWTIDVTVVSFYHFNRHHAAMGAARAKQAASGDIRGKRSGCRRESLLDFIGPDGIARKRPVHKVRYGRAIRRGLLSSRAGVGTALRQDHPGLVLARLRYLLLNPDHLPDHNSLSANGECASLWCVTGRWCTLQGASILAVTSVGQAGGALLAGGILSNLTVLVPMPGLWGMAGWWWYVPATVAYPFLVPMLVAMGMASLVPLEILRRNRKRWKGITDGLNHEFWTVTTDDVREDFFGMMATAERETEMRSFFGVREGESNVADDARYMPVGGSPGGLDCDNTDNGDDEEAEALAMQRMEKTCRDMVVDMKVDLSGRPPPPSRLGGKSGGGGRGAWGNFVGSFRRREVGNFQSDDSLTETERFHTAYMNGPT
ncbi:hypothetical protein ACHAXA_010987 [Cyclostephanos tholiformis]|uniref:Uncharacterized protein n=1 Tax=Cyclostephanos tholiformis TaxID=382380 RepID=A0ABD3RR05_9STRA